MSSTIIQGGLFALGQELIRRGIQLLQNLLWEDDTYDIEVEDDDE